MALVVPINKMTKLFENEEYMIVLFLDFSKIFDTVDHDTLLK